jgi:hypothetical protein
VSDLKQISYLPSSVVLFQQQTQLKSIIPSNFDYLLMSHMNYALIVIQVHYKMYVHLHTADIHDDKGPLLFRRLSKEESLELCK